MLPLSAFRKRKYPNGTVNLRGVCTPCFNKRSKEIYHKRKKEDPTFMVNRRKAVNKRNSKNRKKHNKEQKLLREKCTNNYMKQLLRQTGYQEIELTEERIQFKRAIIQLKRKLKKIKLCQ